MKAIIKTNKNEGLNLIDIEKPQVKPGNLLVKIKAASICGTDIHLYSSSKMMDTWNVSLPLIIGHEISGEIVDIGQNIENNMFNFKIGDRIAADSHVHCDSCFQCINNKKHNCDSVKVLGVHATGAFSEYANIPANIAFKIPNEISFEEGAMLEPFGVSVKSFYLAQPVLTHRIAVFGGGPIGLMIAKLGLVSGLKNVYVFEPSEYRRNIANKIGIDNCIDPLKIENFSSFEKNFDVVFEVSGTAIGLQTALNFTKKNGKVIVVGIYPDEILIDVKNQIMSKELTIIGTFGRLIWETWFQMIELILNNQISLKEIITHRFNFDQYEDAFKIALSGKCGKIILSP